jgi:hypothetical protein
MWNATGLSVGKTAGVAGWLAMGATDTDGGAGAIADGVEAGALVAGRGPDVSGPNRLSTVWQSSQVSAPSGFSSAQTGHLIGIDSPRPWYSRSARAEVGLCF